MRIEDEKKNFQMCGILFAFLTFIDVKVVDR